MTPSLRLAGLVTLVASALTLAACATMTVRSFASPASFTQYRTYGWADDGPSATGDPRLDNNPFFDTRIRADADRQLAARGFEKVTTVAPDLMLHYHASVTQRLDVAGADQKYGYCEGCQTASLYDAGSIMLDFVDARTNTLVWRGWSEASLDGIVDNQDWLEKRIDEAVARIVATIPGRL